MNTALIDVHSERELIGGQLLDPDSHVQVHDVIRPDHYSVEEHRAIQAALSELYQAGQPASISEIAQRAKVSPALLAELMGDVVLGANRRTALRLVELSQKRAVFQQLRAIAQRLPEMSLEELGGELIVPAVSVNLEAAEKRTFSAADIVARVEELQTERQREPGVIRGIRTGYAALDLTLRGQRPGCMTLVAAGTGVGKTGLGLNLAGGVVQQNVPVLLVSTENSADENMDRLAGIITGHEIKDIESGRCASKISGAVRKALEGKKIFLTDNRPRTINEVIGTITRHALRDGVKYVVLDYIGEISPDHSGPRNESEEQRMARWAQMLLDTARTLGIHLVVLAQLNRAGNMRGRPTKTELAHCFRLSHKSAAMLCLWQNDDGTDLIYVDKNRQGVAKIDIAIKYNRATQRIRELGYWLETENRIVAPSNVPGNVADFVDLD